MAARHVLLLTSELATVSAVSLALQSNGKLATEDVCADLGDLSVRLQNGGVPAVVVDIDTQPGRMLAGLEPLVRKFSDTRFVVLSGVMSNDLLLESMQIGARHFMLKQSIAADLSGVLARICPPVVHEQHGAVVSVLSAGGGCGATTVAVNIAAELQLLDHGPTPEPALVVDLDPCYGAVAAYFGVDGEYGLLDLLHRLGPLDPQLIQSTSLSHSDRLHVLISTARARLGEPALLDPQRVAEAIDACKGAYRWTVIDAPRVSTAVAAEIVRGSLTTLIMLQLTVKDIRVTRQMLAGLSAQGIGMESIRVMVNRYRRRGLLITLDEAKRALGFSDVEALNCLSNDYSAVTEAVNMGKPLSQVSPRSDFRRDVQKLAALLSQLVAPITPAVKK